MTESFLAFRTESSQRSSNWTRPSHWTRQLQQFARQTAVCHKRRQAGGRIGNRVPSPSHEQKAPICHKDSPPHRGQATTCQWCGKTPAHERRRCPARSATCHRCSRPGRFQRVCHAPPHASQVHIHREEDGDTQSFLGEVRGQESPTKWTVTLQLNGQPTTLLIDTGA